jgi:hypothetical protein
MWEYRSSQDDGDDELPLEVLQVNADKMLEGDSHNTTDPGQSSASHSHSKRTNG